MPVPADRGPDLADDVHGRRGPAPAKRSARLCGRRTIALLGRRDGPLGRRLPGAARAAHTHMLGQ